MLTFMVVELLSLEVFKNHEDTILSNTVSRHGGGDRLMVGLDGLQWSSPTTTTLRFHVQNDC